MASNNIFKPIHYPDGIFSDAESRSSSVMSSITDNERETPTDDNPTTITTCSNHNSNNNNNNSSNTCNNSTAKLRNRYKQQRATETSNPGTHDPKFLLRRSSSAMRVRELRDALSDMTSATAARDNDEVAVSGSQKARLLVASQQRLVSRLQDLRHELDSMDNEVARVRADIMSSRRYFSAMTGIPCGPDWPLNRQMDSAYTSPMSFMSRSSDSPYNSDDSISTATTNASMRPFQSLQQFENTTGTNSKFEGMTRSDSCSSFMSWRSDVELAGVFPEEPVPLRHVSPQKQFSHYSCNNGVAS